MDLSGRDGDVRQGDDPARVHRARATRAPAAELHAGDPGPEERGRLPAVYRAAPGSGRERAQRGVEVDGEGHPPGALRDDPRRVLAPAPVRTARDPDRPVD